MKVLILLCLLASVAGFFAPHAIPSSSSTALSAGRVCQLLGKRPNRKARVVTFSHRRIHKVQDINLHKRSFQSDKLKRKVTLRLSTKGIKTVEKYGSIDAAAAKFGLDLSKF
ncbi:hypothetical protein TrRE_jg7079 [Triparma retinervis]|uniref:50S ribosomal protein L28 n=1 Tax=Triparma retinervis TaxID=2557542 RepID=A0A9W7E3A8_9STRA|nr:hypothetical protein TrRE_jg7079 [Triparma retinervis]